MKVWATGKAEGILQSDRRARYLVCSQSRNNWERGSQLLYGALKFTFLVPGKSIIWKFNFFSSPGFSIFYLVLHISIPYEKYLKVKKKVLV